jgi:hypothetical protein
MIKIVQCSCKSEVETCNAIEKEQLCSWINNVTLNLLQKENTVDSEASLPTWRENLVHFLGNHLEEKPSVKMGLFLGTMWACSTSAILVDGLPGLGPNRMVKRFRRRREPLPSPLPADATRIVGGSEPPVLVDRRGAWVDPWPEESAAAVFGWESGRRLRLRARPRQADEPSSPTEAAKASLGIRSACSPLNFS